MPGTKNKPEVIIQFTKLITTNHEVNNKLQDSLSLAYTTGVEMGVLAKMLGSDFNKYTKVKNFDITNFICDRVDEVNSRRIANKRSLTYNGPEITADMVLGIDYTVKKTISLMADENSDYMYFKRAHAEKKWIDAKVKRCFDDESRNNARKPYDTKEVYIFMMKCYQVGLSEGYNDADKISWAVMKIYCMAQSIDKYNATNKLTEKHTRVPVDGINDDGDLSDCIVYLKNMKEATPNWEQFKQYFI